MNFNLMNRITAGIVFFASLVVLLMTVQPTVSFWDCGEFIAASYSLQVPHPPGAPFFLMLGRFFSMIPFGENLGFRVNMLSVLSSAFTILFLYLIIVKLIQNYRGKAPKNLLDSLSTLAAGAIGALSFAYSDTFWYSAVEAEVYAASTFLFAAITYLMILWNEKADNKDNEKYILLIAYLTGLSTGVHLMSVLSLVTVVMVIWFRKYINDEEELKRTGYIFMGHAALILLMAIFMWGGQTGSNIPSPEEYQDYDSKFKIYLVVLSAIYIGVFWKKLFTRNSFYFPLIIGGVALFATYPGVVKYIPAFMKTVAGDNITMELALIAVMGLALAAVVRYSIKNNKPTLHLAGMSLILIIIGFSTYSMVIIRSNMQPPMNENEPDNFTRLVSYLNREQYGDFPTFKRRYATEPHQMVVYQNYSSDLDFFWTYQMHHMMTRYLFWNYAGRESWYQDSGPNIAPFNAIGNAIFKPLGLSFAGDTKDSLFGIPLLLGLLGIYFHFRRDWKMASAFMILFIFMGYLTAYYQNQQQPQPRERDYFYVGAFFVFSIWIGIAIKGLAEVAEKYMKEGALRNAATLFIILAGIVLVPVRMLQANYYTHDRSGNYVPWDYSYNLLQSCAPNAILFTNGDNDTFPLWYLQDVEGVRRDVRIANLSLLNTDWYIRQLRNTAPYGSAKVNMTLTDEMINQLRPTQFNGAQKTVTITPQVRKQFDDLVQSLKEMKMVSDSTFKNATELSWFMPAAGQTGDGIRYIRVQDIMVEQIVKNNLGDRPIYFAATCSPDSKIGLDEYLLMEGMAFRVMPFKVKSGQLAEAVNENVMYQQLFNENPGYSKDYKPGFKFRGIADPKIFFDDNHERLSQNYRNSFLRLTIHYLDHGKNDMAVKTLDEMDKKIPVSKIPLDPMLRYQVADLYFRAGASDKFKTISADIEKEMLKMIENNPNDVMREFNPYSILTQIYERNREYKKLVGLYEQLMRLYPQDPNLKNAYDMYKTMADSLNTGK
ncbi:MAG: DUF2723 domain-containing protein [Ignavibacteriaceae bacterium]|nr:DUF2723 domain-containing protein [Ignavibacteriaceae bacterium]